MKFILSSAAVLLGLLGLAFTLLYLGQYKLIYPAPVQSIPANLPPNVERIDFEQGYGLLLTPNEPTSEPTPLLMFTHGNGELAYFWIQEFEQLTGHGLSVLLFEYPGYGGASGKPNRKDIERGVLSAYDHMAARPGIDANRIIAYGRSIGGGAASLLAKHRPVIALCLESTFSSLDALIAEKGFPKFLLREHYKNEAVVRALGIPVFLYHGSGDQLIPVSHSERLDRAAKNSVLITSNCGHNNCARPWPELLNFMVEKLHFLITLE